MKKYLLYSVLFLSVSLAASKKVTKQELYSYWLNKYQQANKNVTYKSVLDSTSVGFIDHLESSGVDTIGVYTTDFPGDLVTDTCQCKNIVTYSYVEWIKEGRSYRQFLKPCCKGHQTVIYSSAIILYYANNRKMIDSQYMMPVITDAFRTASKQIGYYTIYQGHSPTYRLYCKLKNHTKLISFTQFQLEVKSNLFHADNINSSIYHWLKAIQAHLKDSL